MKILLFIGLLFLNGCTAHYSRSLITQSLAELGVTDEVSYVRSADWVLNTGSRITLVGLSKAEFDEFPRASYLLNAALFESFQKCFHYTRLVANSDSGHLFNSAYTENTDFPSFTSLSHNSDYFVVTKLVDIQDKLNTRAEIYEGKTLHPSRQYGLDHVTLQLLVFDAKTEKLLDKIDVKGKSSFMADSQASAQDLFQNTLDEVVLELSGRAGV